MLALSILAVILMSAGLYNLFLVFLSRNPANLSTAVGSLTRASGYKNVRGARGNWIIKDQTECTYTYTVNGKAYYCKRIMNRHKRYLPQKVTIVYLTHFPRHGGIESFTAQVELIIGFFLVFQGIVLIVMRYLVQTA